MSKAISRIPSLDGLRAISILMVVYDHAFRPQLIKFGTLGVMFFFIISSYLIVGILSNDINKNRFNIKTFYFKRVLRIFPAYYFYLSIIFIILKFLNFFKFEQFWRAPLFLTNYQPRSSWNFPQWFVGHTWSLAVEEQFYILIAILFYFISRKNLSEKKAFFILVALIFIVPIIRVSYLYFTFLPEFLTGSIHRSFETVGDSLAVGAILALMKNKITSSKYFLFFKNKTLFLFCIILLLMLLDSSIIVKEVGYIPRYLYSLVGLTLINISIGIIILSCINFSKENVILKLLNSKIMVTIGLWSYSIYIWQQVWLYSWDFSLGIKFAGILICTVFSYYVIELPFLKFRDNYLAKRLKNDC